MDEVRCTFCKEVMPISICAYWNYLHGKSAHMYCLENLSEDEMKKLKKAKAKEKKIGEAAKYCKEHDKIYIVGEGCPICLATERN